VQFVIWLDRNPDMTMQQVKINAYQAVKWVRHASKALTTATIRNCWWKAGILGRTSTSATVPCGATSQRAVTAAASDAGDPEASASNDVVMQDAEVAPDTEFMAKLQPPATRRLRRISLQPSWHGGQACWRMATLC
jgi:hypothetical protein